MISIIVGRIEIKINFGKKKENENTIL